MKKIDLFIPGRLCLFGEHSDWAGEYRKTDRTVKTGKCIIAGTDQGIYGTAEPVENGFFLSQILPDGSASPEQSYRHDLAEKAAAGIFDSYAIGTASVILQKYPDLGLRLNISERTLPIKKGLSSSAATCVLVARAFNQVHQLNLSIEEEMEFAYRGELLTGSHCGRMDQACAYGSTPVLLTFDGDEMTTKIIPRRKPLHFLIVDLRADKNTRKILNDLNCAFTGGDRLLRQALGAENHRITTDACRAIQEGDTEHLGRLMMDAQSIFDEMIAPACPSELTAPGLHKVLGHEKTRVYSWGGKGVGSQGDGTAQFICKGSTERELLHRALACDLGLLCYNLTL